MAGLRNAGTGAGREVPQFAEAARRVESRPENGRGGHSNQRSERAAHGRRAGVTRGGVEVKRTVIAYGAGGRVLAQFPATMGYTPDPLPIGNWKITSVVHYPWFNYN